MSWRMRCPTCQWSAERPASTARATPSRACRISSRKSASKMAGSFAGTTAASVRLAGFRCVMTPFLSRLEDFHPQELPRILAELAQRVAQFAGLAVQLLIHRRCEEHRVGVQLVHAPDPSGQLLVPPGVLRLRFEQRAATQGSHGFVEVPHAGQKLIVLATVAQQPSEIALPRFELRQALRSEERRV